MSSLTDILCYLPWVCAIVLSKPRIFDMIKLLDQTDGDALAMCWLYIIAALWKLNEQAKYIPTTRPLGRAWSADDYNRKQATTRVLRICASLQHDGLSMRGFFSAIGYTTLICLEYFALFVDIHFTGVELEILLQPAVSPGNSREAILLAWVVSALLMTLLQMKVPSKAAIVRYTVVFVFILVSVDILPFVAKCLTITSEIVAKIIQPRRA